MKRLALAVLLLPACLAESLENAPCITADDCAGNYQCVYTETQRLAPNGVGFCRPDGACAVGLQDGCAAAGNNCLDDALDDVCDPETDLCFCCNLDTSTSSVPNPASVAAIGDIAADGSSAVCIVCPDSNCEPPLEPCLAGEDRCEIDDSDDHCGCRVMEEDIENSECDVDGDCGADFLCVRTLEQLAEPEEALNENQGQELGLCQPDDDPACANGLQNGCAIATGFDSCTGGLLNICNEAGQCFCCASQTEASGFSHHVYAVAADGSSAACTACPYCDQGNTCTRETDATCELDAGSLCGCTPP